MSRRIYLSQPEFPESLGGKIAGFMKNPDLSGSSSVIKEFEGKVSQLCGNRPAVGLSNGTAAIHLALMLLGVGKGDHVACQSFSFCASANPIQYVGAIPVFIDSERDSWNMCPNTLKEYLARAKSENKLPKAIIYVHTYGMPAMVNELVTVAAEYEIPLIEDAAEAIGSKYGGKPVGQFGVMSVFSFNGNKIATTSGGGILLSTSQKLIERATYLATQARASDQFEHDEVGYNYRIGALNALVGSAQLDDLNDLVLARRKRFEKYIRTLDDFDDLEWQPELSGSYSNRWLSTVLISKGTDIATTIASFDQQNIELKRLWKPLHLQKSFAGTKFYGEGVCNDLWNRGLCLPSGSGMSDYDLERVIEQIRKLIT